MKFISKTILSIVDAKLEMINGERAIEMKKYSSPLDWCVEMQTITINAGRRMGHTTALYKLSKKHPDMLIVVRNEALRHMLKGMGVKCDVKHMCSIDIGFSHRMMRDSKYEIIAVDDWSVLQKSSALELKYLYACLPKIVLLVG